LLLLRQRKRDRECGPGGLAGAFGLAL